eukprot:364914-Chlamydomonas_euryale.AAC.2
MQPAVDDVFWWESAVSRPHFERTPPPTHTLHRLWRGKKGTRSCVRAAEKLAASRRGPKRQGSNLRSWHADMVSIKTEQWTPSTLSS